MTLDGRPCGTAEMTDFARHKLFEVDPIDAVDDG